MNTAQKIVINLGGLSTVFVLFLTFILSTISIVSAVIILAAILILVLVSYKIISSPNLLNKPTSVKEKDSKMTSRAPLNISNDRNTQKLDNLVTMTEGRLLKISTVFPFELFQDDIIIEQKQIIIIRRNFFYSSQQYPFSIKDILAPVVESGLFFASLKLELGPGGYLQNPPSVAFLKKDEAQRARRIIMGLIVCDKENIDLTGMDRGEILSKVEEIGRFKSS